MTLLFLYWGILVVFYIIASKLRHKNIRPGFIEKALNVIIYILVFVMGLRMGANEEVTSNLGNIGLQSLGITLFAVAGSMAAITLIRKIIGLDRQGMPVKKHKYSAEEQIEKELLLNELDADFENSNSENRNDSGFKTTVIILAFVVIGMALGYLAIPMIFEDVNVFQDLSGDLLVAGICVLLAFVGFNLGFAGTVIESLKAVGIKVIFIPLAAVAGSLILGAVYGLISPLTIKEAVAVSAGFGWYTLAPGMIGEAGYAVAGAVSFMHNVIRETLGIVIIPLAAKKIGYLEATAIPGVAAMDVCLPIVERSCRPETVVYSFCTGAFMSAVVPAIVPLVIG